MVTYSEHLSRILLQILESYDILKDMDGAYLDVPGIKKEVHKINGLIRAIMSNISRYDVQSSDFGVLRSKFSKYLEEYDFQSELDTISMLYAEDKMRINNLRIIILESLADRKMMETVREVYDEL